jgi:hypothetical protein
MSSTRIVRLVLGHPLPTRSSTSSARPARYDVSRWRRAALGVATPGAAGRLPAC